MFETAVSGMFETAVNGMFETCVNGGVTEVARTSKNDIFYQIFEKNVKNRSINEK